MINSDKKQLPCSATRRAFIWTRLLDTPFWAIFNMLPFILYKDLHATPLQLAIIIALKPLSSIFSLYWCSEIQERPDRLIPNVLWGGVIRHLPFFLFPFIHNVWFFIIAFGLHMMLARGAQPAWMEILKRNLPSVTRERTFANVSSLAYLGDALLPFILGTILDSYFQSWRWLFPLTAAVSLISTFLLFTIPIKIDKTALAEHHVPQLKNRLLQPWKDAWNLMTTRPDFAKFQIGFMLGGSGLMILQPALPIFFVDVLDLSYIEFAIALTACKGIGYALTSRTWANWMRKINIYRFNSNITLLAALFPLLLLAAKEHLLWLYIGYLIYGVMQAGSTLSWNLSGPIFSNEKDSTPYTSVNVVTVGLRGCVAPALGSLLCQHWGGTPVLLASSLICFLATWQLQRYNHQYENEKLASSKASA